MYNHIKEFREFIASASDEQIEKVIAYINVIGFFEGDRGADYSNELLFEHAIEYAKSNYCSVSNFLIGRLGIDLYDL